jgi:hypothetical protein
LVSVALDVQGPDSPRRYAEATLGTFPTLVDEDNVLGDTFGLKAIPNALFVSAEGEVDGIVASSFDIRRPKSRELIERWLATSTPYGVPDADPDMKWSDEALRLFRAAAVELLNEAFPLEPDNYIIRKQLWAIEHPEKFYLDDVDFDWQDEQLASGR